MKTAISHCVAGQKPRSPALRVRTPGRQRRQSVRDRVEHVHPVVDAQPAKARERERGDDRQPDVEKPEASRRVADPGRQRLHLRPRKLRLEQLAPAHPQPWQHRQREHDDPHAPEPLRQLPPKQQRLRQRLDVGQDRRTGGREAGHRLEIRVDGIRELSLPREQVGEANRTPHRQADVPATTRYASRAPTCSDRPASRSTSTPTPKATHRLPRVSGERGAAARRAGQHRHCRTRGVLRHVLRRRGPEADSGERQRVTRWPSGGRRALTFAAGLLARGWKTPETSVPRVPPKVGRYDRRVAVNARARNMPTTRPAPPASIVDQVPA